MDLCRQRGENKILEMKMKRFFALLIIGGFLLAACSASPSASLVGEWKLVSYGDSTSLTPAAPGVDTSIVFDSDGKVTGNVGCNGFGGEYKVDGGTITFREVMSTLMFCEGPVGDQETVTLAVISESATFVLDGSMLTITSADGNSVIALARR